MAIEKERGCGFRKIGGLYIVGPILSKVCGRLPIPLVPCPCCDHRIEFSRRIHKYVAGTVLRGLWESAEGGDPDMADTEGVEVVIDSRRILPRCPLKGSPACPPCLMDTMVANSRSADPKVARRPVALMWVGENFYPTVEDYVAEAREMGICKRIYQLPKWFKVGITPMFLAHPKAIGGEARGVFTVFIPQAIEQIVPDTISAEEEESLRERGITPVKVPADDPDHAAETRGRPRKAASAEEE